MSQVFDQMEEDVLLLSHSDTYENYLRSCQ